MSRGRSHHRSDAREKQPQAQTSRGLSQYDSRASSPPHSLLSLLHDNKRRDPTRLTPPPRQDRIAPSQAPQMTRAVGQQAPSHHSSFADQLARALQRVREERANANRAMASSLSEQGRRNSSQRMSFGTTPRSGQSMSWSPQSCGSEYAHSDAIFEMEMDEDAAQERPSSSQSRTLPRHRAPGAR